VAGSNLAPPTKRLLDFRQRAPHRGGQILGPAVSAPCRCRADEQLIADQVAQPVEVQR
jgi:hypothetical protein